MYISNLSIRNYRNFKSVSVDLKKGVNTIIGENGAGKSNLFQALRLLIDDSLPRYTKFYETDFNRSIGGWQGHWIIIRIEFDELDASEEIQTLAIQAAGHMGAEPHGSYSLYFRPNSVIRKKLFDYSQEPAKNPEGLQAILDTITLEDYETIFLCRGSGNFNNDALYTVCVGNFSTIVFPDPEHDDQGILGTWPPREINLLNEISCTFIKALRDVESDLKSYSNNPLINLLRGKEKTVSIAKSAEIINSIDDLNNKISDLDEVKEVKTGIDKSIKDAVGSIYAPNIDIKSELPNEMEKLFLSLKLWVGDPDDEGYKGRIWELSLGGANLIFLSLKLLEYEKIKTDRAANFLLIEEPEAHIHTHIQKTLFNRLNENRTQVIISTHSTHISSVSKISSVSILSRGAQQAHLFKPSNNLTPDEITRIERYLDAVRSTLLFAKGILLVEGDAEQILIPAMFQKVFGISLDEIGISLINIGSTGFENIGRIFHQDRIGRKCSIITDFDKSILPLKADPKDDDEIEKHCRASEKKGAERKIILEEFVKGNACVELFFGNYTFEVEFLLADNKYEAKQCVNSVYSQAKKRETITAGIDDATTAIAGSAILEMANYHGKGWFAILLTEYLQYNTAIPKYILDAIAHAASHINKATLATMANHRLNQGLANKNNSKELIAKIAASKKLFNQAHTKATGMEEFLVDFANVFAGDQLTYFIKAI